MSSFRQIIGRSSWVADNYYDFYEIPLKGNEFKIVGDFIFLAHNIHFDYWIFGEMKYSIDESETKRTMSLVDNASFIPFGTYDVIVNKNEHSIQKKRLGRNTDYGFLKPNGLFDTLGIRKKAYKTSASKLIGSLTGINQNIGSLKGEEEVKIYKKNKK